jgi:hypothetical protein
MDAIRIDWQTEANQPTPKLHQLPCYVAQTGEAKVSTFFLTQSTPTTSEETNSITNSGVINNVL